MKTVLEDLPRLTVRDMVSGGAFNERGGLLIVYFGDRWLLYCRPDLESMIIKFEALDRINRTRVKSRVGLVTRPTNLGNGSMWLFHSFRTNKEFRVLFLVNGEMVGRADIIGPRYKQQLQGRARRLLSRYHRPSPARPYGKPIYRGKLTPYGRRLQRYDEMADYLDDMVSMYYAHRAKIWRDEPAFEPLRDFSL